MKTIKTSKFTIAAFAAYLFVMICYNLVTPARAFSERENRMLTSRPELILRDVLSGSFSRQFEDYITDQFAIRDKWVLLKSDIERALLRTENKGIFFGQDGYLLEHYRRPGSALNSNILRVNRFAELFPHISTSLMLVPNSVAIHHDRLPMFASPYDQRKVLGQLRQELAENILWLDIFDTLYGHRDKYIYFRTDHHWTMLGAFYAYQATAAQLGFEPYSFEDFYMETVTNDFWGTYSSRANHRGMRSDSIEVLRPRFTLELAISFKGKLDSFPSMFFPEHLETRDKFAYFLDSNHPLTVINTNVQNGRKLVVFKDSYAHVLLPFLAAHYEEIHVIDLRLFNVGLQNYVSQHNFDQALFLFNVSSFSSDRNIINLR